MQVNPNSKLLINARDVATPSPRVQATVDLLDFTESDTCKSNATRAGSAMRTVHDGNDATVYALLEPLDRARIIELTHNNANSFGKFGNKRIQMVVRVPSIPSVIVLIQRGIIEKVARSPNNFASMSIGKPRRELYCGIESASGKLPATGASNSLNTRVVISLHTIFDRCSNIAGK